MKLNEKELARQVQRLMCLPFSGEEPNNAGSRAVEFQRILRAGCTSDEMVRKIVDQAIDQCGDCPAPSVLVQMIQQMNETARRAVEAERNLHAEWRQQYGPPKPLSSDNCMCGKSWSEILAEIRETDRRVTRRVKELLADPNFKLVEDSRTPSLRAYVIRELGIVPHSKTCPASGDPAYCQKETAPYVN